MAAVAEVMSTVASQPDPRGCDIPDLPGVCGLNGGGGSVCLSQRSRQLSYLWTCETCGYGFVTRHAMKKFACN